MPTPTPTNPRGTRLALAVFLSLAPPIVAFIAAAFMVTGCGGGEDDDLPEQRIPVNCHDKPEACK